MRESEFSPEEIEVLGDVLRHAVDELETEIFHTGTYDFKVMLKHRLELLTSVLEKVSAAPVVA